jgi:hypothetical protein
LDEQDHRRRGLKRKGASLTSKRTIKGLRILPPFAIARLGSAAMPMDNYTIDLDVAADDDTPLGYRAIKPQPTLYVNEESGEIEAECTPPKLEFKEGESDQQGEGNAQHEDDKHHVRKRIRPVAPFLEVFAVTDGDDVLVPLTIDLLKENDVAVKDLSWNVRVANRKVARRTADNDDIVHAEVEVRNHGVHRLLGTCANFVAGKHVDFGRVRFIKPNDEFPEIRLRFTPGKGLIYGPEAAASARHASASDPEHATASAAPAFLAHYHLAKECAVYDGKKNKGRNWEGFGDPAREEDKDSVTKKWREHLGWPPDFNNETVPPDLFAIEPPAPSWLFDNRAISRGYLDDACDGFVEVHLTLPNGRKLDATARICVAPPAMAPDALFVRSLADDLDQVVHGPGVAPHEPPEVTRARALDIVRRAFETVRFMNVVVMNGNDFKGRAALSLDSMPEEEAADTERAIRPVMGPGTVDTFAAMTLHQQAYAALRGGAAPWFVRLLRRPNEVADFTDHGRRKMPALMCGADNNYLALTWRQIHTIEKTALDPPVAQPATAAPVAEGLTPRNLSAQIHYEAKGNPICSRPVTSVANCCPGLEVDFRAVWRRMFKGVELREHDNLVVRADQTGDAARIKSVDGALTVADLAGHRLLRVVVPHGKGEIALPMMTPIKGPASSDPDGKVDLTTNMNPFGLAALEWSNALARVLPHAGKKVRCDFSKDVSWEQQQLLYNADAISKDQQLSEDLSWEQKPPKGSKNYISFNLEVRPFFKDDTAVISDALAQAGELTQGLCSPWQNDYRECSCYYWASARPDFVNVTTTAEGFAAGDNWMQRQRTGFYIADDYADMRLMMYDELFRDWETKLQFQVGGYDYPTPVKPDK